MSGDPEFLTVPELAELLRIKERKVYDLASAGEVPCTRATGKLLFPSAQVRAWIDAKRSGIDVQRPDVFLGSHDPLLEWALRQSRSGLATFFDGSGDGLARFKAGEGVATGLHLHDDETGEWNIPHVARDCGESNSVLIAWAKRQRGLVVQPCSADQFRDLEGVKGKRVALRQPQSGTAGLWRRLLDESGIEVDGFEATPPHHSEQDAVIAVAEDAADVTFGLQAVAQQFNLEFIPLVEERFDLLVDRAAFFEPPIQGLLAFCQSNEFQSRAAGFHGYDLTDLGKVRWNA